jgi:hypothetical protein
MRIRVFVPLVMLLLLGACASREEKLIAQGDALIARIDSFQKATQRLPENLGELHIEEKMEGPLYYQKRSDSTYMVHFGTTLGESMIYRSERKKWEDH